MNNKTSRNLKYFKFKRTDVKRMVSALLNRGVGITDFLKSISGSASNDINPSDEKVLKRILQSTLMECHINNRSLKGNR